MRKRSTVRTEQQGLGLCQARKTTRPLQGARARFTCLTPKEARLLHQFNEARLLHQSLRPLLGVRARFTRLTPKEARLLHQSKEARLPHKSLRKHPRSRKLPQHRQRGPCKGTKREVWYKRGPRKLDLLTSPTGSTRGSGNCCSTGSAWSCYGTEREVWYKRGFHPAVDPSGQVRSDRYEAQALRERKGHESKPCVSGKLDGGSPWVYPDDPIEAAFPDRDTHLMRPISLCVWEFLDRDIKAPSCPRCRTPNNVCCIFHHMYRWYRCRSQSCFLPSNMQQAYRV